MGFRSWGRRESDTTERLRVHTRRYYNSHLHIGKPQFRIQQFFSKSDSKELEHLGLKHRPAQVLIQDLDPRSKIQVLIFTKTQSCLVLLVQVTSTSTLPSSTSFPDSTRPVLKASQTERFTETTQHWIWNQRFPP